MLSSFCEQTAYILEIIFTPALGVQRTYYNDGQLDQNFKEILAKLNYFKVGLLDFYHRTFS